jgi:hypothetical protein
MPSALIPSLAPPPKTGQQEFDRWAIKLYQGDTLSGIVTETTATRTVAITDKYIICNRAGTITLTLPDPALAGSRSINIRTYTANTVVSATANVVGATGGAAATAILAATAGKWADIVSDGQNWITIRNN